MGARRRLTYAQTDLLNTLAGHKAKFEGHRAEFEARKNREYEEEKRDLEEAITDTMAALLDLGTPKIRIAEMLGTRNYTNLARLDALAQAKRKAQDGEPVVPTLTHEDGAPVPEEEGAVDEIDVAAAAQQWLAEIAPDDLGTLNAQMETETEENEYGEWFETWSTLHDGETVEFLRWYDDPRDPQATHTKLMRVRNDDLYGAVKLHLANVLNDEVVAAFYG
jgi:hypothetical protein